jgi:hypothetical protein
MLARTKWLRGLSVAAVAAFALAACEDTVVNVPPVEPPPPPPITITATPAQMDLVVGQTQQVVATVTGGAEGTSRAVNFSSSNTNVATVDAQGVVTAVAPGTATVIAAAAADPNVRAGVGVTVRDAIPPGPDASVTIAGVTQGGTTTPVNPAAVTGQIDVMLNVERGNAQRLEVLLGDRVVDACTQVFGAANEPQPITAEGLSLQATTIVCSINTAAFDVVDGQGVPLFPNAAHQLRARLVAADGSTLDAATGPTLTFQNVDFVDVQVSAANTALDAGGLLWHGGDVTATAIPVSFSGVAISSVTFQARTGATVVATRSDDTGPFSVTFPATGTAAEHVRNLAAENFNVRVTSVTAAGQPGPTATTGNIRLDNAAPVITTQPTNFGPWIGGNFAFTAAGVGIVATDANPVGVGRLTYTVQVRPVGGTAAQWTDVASPADVGERQTRDREFRVIVCDALGTCTVSATSAPVGVDLTPPTAGVLAPAPALINPTTSITVTASDVPSGFAGDFVGVRIVRYTQTGTGALLTRCYNITTDVATDPADHPGGVCPFVWRASSTVNVPAGQPAYYEITVRVRDQAGNFSDTITRLHLRDTTAPTVTATGLAFTATSFTVSGTVSDNVDLAAWDTRLRYGAVGPRSLLTFEAPTVVGEFGLPLTASAAAQGTTTIIRGIQEGVAGTPAALDMVGFGGHDVAGNFAFGGLGFAPGGATAVTGIDNFTLGASRTVVCKTGTTAACDNVAHTSTTLRATAHSGVDTSNPLSVVHFYMIDGPAGNEHSVYLGAIASGAADLFLGPGNVREWRFDLPVDVAQMNFGANEFFAVGVNAARDGIISTNVTVTAQ